MSRPGRSDAPLDLRRVLAGLSTFVLFGALGLWAAHGLDPGGTVSARGIVGAVPSSILLICVALALLDPVLGGARLHLWISRVSPGATFGASFQTYLVNLFAAAVSPMGSASVPAQVAALAHYGVQPARAFAALILKFISVLGGFLIVVGLGLLYLASGPGLEGVTRTLLGALLAFVLGVMALVVLAVGNPRLGHALARWIARLGGDGAGRVSQVARRAGHAIDRGVSDYQSALTSLTSEWRRPMVASLLLSSLMVLNKCLIGYLLTAGMGYEGGFPEVAARQSIQWLLIYFSPSPGGSGLAEASVPAFLTGIVPPGSVVTYAVLWRVITGFIGPALGALSAARILRTRRPSPSRSVTES